MARKKKEVKKEESVEEQTTFKEDDMSILFDEFGNIIFSTHYNVYNIICRNVYVASGKLLFVKPDFKAFAFSYVFMSISNPL